MVKRVLKILFLIFLIVGTIYIIGRKRQETLRHLAGPVFGTEFKIEYVSADTLGSAIRAELEQVNQSLSMFAPGSTVSRINDGRSSDTDEMLREVFLLSQRISQQTGELSTLRWPRLSMPGDLDLRKRWMCLQNRLIV